MRIASTDQNTILPNTFSFRGPLGEDDTTAPYQPNARSAKQIETNPTPTRKCIMRFQPNACHNLRRSVRSTRRARSPRIAVNASGLCFCYVRFSFLLSRELVSLLAIDRSTGAERCCRANLITLKDARTIMAAM